MRLSPIDSVSKLITNLVLWWVGGALGNAGVLILTSSIVNFPETPQYVGLNLVKPVGLIAINAFVIWQRSSALASPWA